MRVLALEPYYGGSHRSFLDDWKARSRHDWTLLTLPAYKWKWRMRHAAVTMAAMIRRRARSGERWDGVFATDMLNLAELRGLAPRLLRGLPTIFYFHENQITYPVRVEKERDFQFGMTNIISAVAAHRVWFNSHYHRDTFLDAVPPFLNRMPDFRPLEAVDVIRDKAEVRQPGVACLTRRSAARPAGPLRILWAARWEFDKNPECLFEALERLDEAGVPFRVSVLGESFRETPEVFERARGRFRGQIEDWGYQSRRSDYQRALLRADVYVSTALHEFFGIGTVEAMSAGAFPLLPRRLSYPELLDLTPRGAMETHFYDGGAAQLARRLRDLSEHLEATGSVWGSTRERCAELASRFCWSDHAATLDEALTAAFEEAEGPVPSRSS